MTVQSQGFYSWRRVVDRYQVQMFRRVTKVYLYGPQYTGDLLPQFSKFHNLRELELLETSIPSSDLEAWKKQHPQVTVTARRTVLTR